MIWMYFTFTRCQLGLTPTPCHPTKDKQLQIIVGFRKYLTKSIESFFKDGLASIFYFLNTGTYKDEKETYTKKLSKFSSYL